MLVFVATFWPTNMLAYISYLRFSHLLRNRTNLLSTFSVGTILWVIGVFLNGLAEFNLRGRRFRGLAGSLGHGFVVVLIGLRGLGVLHRSPYGILLGELESQRLRGKALVGLGEVLALRRRLSGGLDRHGSGDHMLNGFVAVGLDNEDILTCLVTAANHCGIRRSGILLVEQVGHLYGLIVTGGD